MTWQGSRGEGRNWRPPGYQALRLQVLARDGGRCTLCGSTDRVTVDAIIPSSAGGSHSDLTNLRALCHRHHSQKSQSEAAAARRKLSSRRPDEPHPSARRRAR